MKTVYDLWNKRFGAFAKTKDKLANSYLTLDAFQKIVEDIKQELFTVQEFQKRVLNEKVQLDARATILSEHIGSSPVFSKLALEDQELLREQNDIMWKYSEILAKRISRFQKMKSTTSEMITKLDTPAGTPIKLTSVEASDICLELDRLAKVELEAAALLASMREVLKFQGQPVGPSIHDWAKWRRLVESKQ